MAAFVRATKPAAAPAVAAAATSVLRPGLLRVTDAPILKRLSTLDRYLPLWIFGGDGARASSSGGSSPAWAHSLDRVQVAGVSVPIGLGLLWMMYPVLAKVRYESIGSHVADRRLIGTSLVLNWVVGPVVMFALAWWLLPDLPAYRNGLVIVGLARCIAMVLIWNTLAGGSSELAAVLVALNSIFQVLTYSFLGYLFLNVVPGWLGGATASLDVSMLDIARSVLIFLGVPLLAGYWTRRTLVRRRGVAWYEGSFLPRIGPTALVGLLYTIVLMFAMQGDRILDRPGDVVRIALPLLLYFLVMFGLSLAPHLAPASSGTRMPRPSPSPPPATTSSSPSPWRSAPSASPRARRSPPWSVP